METQCKTCLSEHREEIEQAARAGKSLRDISETLRVKYNEHISHTSIGTHLDKHKTNAEETALELAKANEKRIRNLEIDAYLQRASGEDYGISVYNIHGQATYRLKRENFLLRGIPDSEQLEAEYNAMIEAMQDEIRAEHVDHLDSTLYTEALEVRAVWAEEDAKKAAEVAKQRAIESAKLELLERENQQAHRLENIELAAKKLERRERLQKLRDEKLEEEAGIDSEGNPIVEN